MQIATLPPSTVPTIHFTGSTPVTRPAAGLYYDIPDHGMSLCFEVTPNGAWYQSAIGTAPFFVYYGDPLAEMRLDHRIDPRIPLVIIHETRYTQVEAYHLQTLPWMVGPTFGLLRNATLCGKRLDQTNSDTYTGRVIETLTALPTGLKICSNCLKTYRNQIEPYLLED